MPRDFASERYVRTYTADTAGWLLLGWQGQCVWSLLYRKADLRGFVSIGTLQPWQAAMQMCHLPLDVAQPGMESCIAVAWIVHVEQRLEFPRYVDANGVAKTAAQRQREFRERKRDETLRMRNESLRSVTLGHDGVTAGHAGVTPSHETLRVVPSLGVGSKDEHQRAIRAAAWLSKVTGREPFVPHKHWREWLVQLSDLLENEAHRNAAAKVLASEAARGIDVALILSPSHVVTQWHWYSVGKAPGKRLGAVAAAPVPTELEQLQEQYAELDRKERACLFDEEAKRERLNEQMSKLQARMKALKEGQNGRA